MGKSKEIQYVQNPILDFLAWQRKVIAYPTNLKGVYDPVKKIFRKPSKRFKPGYPDITGIWQRDTFLKCPYCEKISHFLMPKPLAIECKYGKRKQDARKSRLKKNGSNTAEFIGWLTGSTTFPI